MRKKVEIEVEMKSSELESFCRAKLRGKFTAFRTSEIRVSFYPYVGLTHTIRRRGSCWILRISDHCRSAPRIVIEAIVVILACKVLRRRPPRDAVEVYEQFRKDPEVQLRVRMRRLKRGRKRIGDPRGKEHSLSEIFQELNQRFFNNQIELQKLGWGTRKSWGRLGHYDPLHQTIAISPVLDSPDVPRFVVMCILYHEMLHAIFDQPSDDRRRHHPPEFRKAEKAFPGYAEAKKFLREFCRSRGKRH
jgi:hypothetical protein